MKNANVKTVKDNKTTSNMSLETMVDFLRKSPKAENPNPFKDSTIFHYLRKK